MKILRAFFYSVTTLTAMPVTTKYLPSESDADTISMSILFYPLIGFFIAVIVDFLVMPIPDRFPTLLHGAIAVGLWMLMTGGRELRALAATADAAALGTGQKQRTLDILHDSAIGAGGILFMVMLLILKMILLATLFEQIDSWALVFIAAAVFSRLLAVFYIWLTPYARESGWGADVSLMKYQAVVLFTTAACVVLLGIFSSILTTVVLMLVLIGWLGFWCLFWMERIGGYTVDCVGALIAVAEVIVLLVLLWAHA